MGTVAGSVFEIVNDVDRAGIADPRFLEGENFLWISAEQRNDRKRRLVLKFPRRSGDFYL